MHRGWLVASEKGHTHCFPCWFNVALLSRLRDGAGKDSAGRLGGFVSVVDDDLWDLDVLGGFSCWLQ